MGSLVKYGSYDIETAKKEAEQLASEGGDFMKFVAGKNVVRILPPRVGQKSPFLITYQHFINVAEKSLSFTCPRMMQKKPCPACKHAEGLRASGIPADRDAGFKYLPKRRVYAAVIDRKQPEMGPRILPFGKMIHESLLSLRSDDDWGDFSHPEDGYDVTVEKSGEGLKTEYKVLPRKHGALAQTVEQMDEWLSNLPDMGRFSFVPSTNEILQKFGSAGIDLDDEADAPPARRSIDADIEE